MRQKHCRKCGDYIPCTEVVDGKRRFYAGRKFCLKCSPFNQHNTKTDTAVATKRPGRYKNWSSEEKLMHKARVYKRGIEIKIAVMESKGGKCTACGYCGPLRCMSFHHRDPTLKSFALTITELWSRSLEEAKVEAEKCDLLCLNCHGEVEDKKYGKYKRNTQKPFRFELEVAIGS